MSEPASKIYEQEQICAKESLLKTLVKVNGLEQVEQLILSKTASEAPLLAEISAYLFTLGGKRIRPILTLLTAEALGMKAPSQPLIDVSAGIELIHMATLLHDDIIDRSPKRRHKESPFIKYGSDSSLLAGDFLLVRAFSLCARLDSFIIDQTEQACIALTEGEILETPLYQDSHSLSTTINIAKKKTASLFRLATCSAAHLTQISSDSISLMADFGENLGIAFQALDDVLDVTASEDLLGKQSGIDIRERKPSLMNILWLESGSQLAKQLLSKPDQHDEEFVSAALTEIRSSPTIDLAKEIARSFADKAKSCLNQVEQNVPTNKNAALKLHALVEYTLTRLG